MNSNPAFSRNAAFRPGQVSRAELEAMYGPNASTTTTDTKDDAAALERLGTGPA